MVHCSHCGTKSQDGDSYCRDCGKPLIDSGASSTLVETNAQRLRVLGRKTYTLEFNKNFYSDLGMVGDAINQCWDEAAAWTKNLDLGLQGEFGEFTARAADQLQVLYKQIERLKHGNPSKEFFAMSKEAISFLSETMASQFSQEKAILHNDSKLMDAAQRQMKQALRHKEMLDKLVCSYEQSKSMASCPNCRTWVDRRATRCTNCGRCFAEAERLGLVYLRTISVCILEDFENRRYLFASYPPEPDSEAPDIVIPIVTFVDATMSRLSGAVRQNALLQMTNLNDDLNRMFVTKEFRWDGLSEDKPEHSKSVAEIAIHSVVSSRDLAKSDILFDTDPLDFDLVKEAAFVLPALVKWALQFGNTTDSAKILLAGLVLVGYKQRWSTGQFENGPMWIQKTIEGLNRLGANAGMF